MFTDKLPFVASILICLLVPGSFTLSQLQLNRICSPGLQLNTHPTKCDQFVHCQYGRGYEQACHDDTRYNPMLGVCDWRRDTDCLAIILHHRRLGCWNDPQRQFFSRYAPFYAYNVSIPFYSNMSLHLDACVRGAHAAGFTAFSVAPDGSCWTNLKGMYDATTPQYRMNKWCSLEAIPDRQRLYFAIDVFIPGVPPTITSEEEVPATVFKHRLLSQCLKEKNPLRFPGGYGCHCGVGGSGDPVDGIDECCQKHDECFANIDLNGICAWAQSPYLVPYRYDKCHDPYCKPPEYYWWAGSCRSQVCECDAAAFRCFKRHLPNFNDAFVNYDKQANC
ncbi:uncharacterized protein LOC106170266 [Lingula anatina]|uniref:Phospholipase A2 n=1 Tax=Lingula anatina TaxID=7574 RepID=A0A1S3IAI9_LINAN|nr:uncharacterized protein LOC106162517 [Lingula anatina]XP_013405515.1 uncharacterized protein LOC106170266 [Lingula anatina]|eukprot:XP_013395277.1 uncharacterized protein LOC106162517 [Lingula anatina]